MEDNVIVRKTSRNERLWPKTRVPERSKRVTLVALLRLWRASLLVSAHVRVARGRKRGGFASLRRPG
jgi:hypothetical protein